MQNFVFDLYGTLIDVRTDESDEGFRRDFSRYFERLTGIERDVWPLLSAFFENRGEEEADFVAEMTKTLDKFGKKREYAKKLAEYFRKRSVKRLALYDGARETLQKLKDKGAKLYVLSNAQAAFTLPELKGLGIYELFDGIELSSEFGFKKPCLKFCEYILAKYGLKREETAFVGNDIAADIVPAKKVGLKTAYIRTEISPAEDSAELAKNFADVAIDNDFEKLAEVLEAWI